MRSVFRFFLFIISFILVSFNLNGSSFASQLIIQKISLEEGLPNNKVNSIVQDKYGFMWFGTNDGLCRYDGFQLRSYSLDNYSGADSRTPQISVIKNDSMGNMLIGSYSLFYYNYATDKIEECEIVDDHNSVQIIGRVHAIEIGCNGDYFVGAENGLFIYDPVKKKAFRISDLLTNRNYILSLFSDGEKLWIGTKQGKLYNYWFESKQICSVSAFNLPAVDNNQILCFFKPKADILWMGSQNSGLFQFDLKDSSLTVINPDPQSDLTLRIRKIVKDAYGAIWLGTRGGLFQYDEGRFIYKANQGDRISDMTSSSIYDIFIDDNSTLWMGTYSGGVNYIQLNRKPFNLQIPEQSILGSWKSNINCIAEDLKSNLWIGTENYGLIFKDKRSGKFKYYAKEHSQNPNLSQSTKTIAVDTLGNVWVGAYSGLSYIDLKNNNIVDYNTTNSAICSNQIRSIQIDHDQNLWIGTNKGLCCFNPNTKNFTTLFSGMNIHPVYIDHDQSVWFGTSPDGIFRKKVDQNEFEKVYRQYFNSFIRCILMDSNHNLWIGNNKGLFVVDHKTNQLTSFGLNEGLPTLRINGLLEDDDKNIWVGTGAGLLKGNKAIDQPQKTTFNKFSLNDGLQGQLFRVNAYTKGRNGEMYFGGDNGYNEFMPSEIKSNSNPPKIALTDFKIFNRVVEIGQNIDGYIVLPKAINELKRIDLSYKHRLFTIDFAALHYTNPAGNQYRYRLFPFQKEWIYSSGLRNFANYSNLKGGTYTFELEAANCDNIWNPNTRKLVIRVHPPFWTTVWFMLCSLAMMLALVVVIYRYRLLRLKRNNYELEKKVVVRTKELKDSLDQLIKKQSVIEEQAKTLNSQKEKLQELISTKDKFFTIIAHDLKNPFHSILGMAELLQNKLKDDPSKETRLFVREIFNSTQHLYHLLEHLLTWSQTQTSRIAINPKELMISELIKISLVLFEKNISVKQIDVEFKIESEGEVLADRNMIETVIRNLLSNAIKYTPIGGKINISVQLNSNDIKVAIADSGIGIRPNELNKLFKIGDNTSRQGTAGEKGTGLGLTICKEFILRHKGKIWAESELHKGSTFYFTIPRND